MSWLQYFPYKEVRPQQEKAIDFILESFKNKRYVILELPTGVGKSAIAITVSKYYDDAWIVTPQRVLQKQYQNDFSWLPTIWSKEHYECDGKNGIMCPLGTLINNVYKGKFCDCKYKTDKKMFLGNSISLTNIAFFLNHVEYSEEIKPRQLLVVDEAHNLENIISDFVSVTISQYAIENYGLAWPDINNATIEQVVSWVNSKVLTQLGSFKENLEVQIKMYNEEELINSGEGKQLLKQIDSVERLIGQLERCVSRFVVNEWVMTISKERDEIKLRPIFASKFSFKQLFCKGEKILLMSGTILDKEVFCKNIGIPKDEVAFLSLDSPFPKENRAVFATNVCSLSYKNIDNNLPKIVNAINKLITLSHKNEKGIIHCNSYKIANYIAKNAKHKNRFLIHDSTNRIEMYELHLGTKDPTILVSPSLTEGIDLVDDLSRFQIIVKTPFPYLGDNYITTKMTRIPGWYEWETTKTIVQASGRSVRNTNDHCITYILDSDFTFFFKKNSNMFPKWYRDALFFI